MTAGIAASEKKAKDMTARGQGGAKVPSSWRNRIQDDTYTAQDGGMRSIPTRKRSDASRNLEAMVWGQGNEGYVTDPIRSREPRLSRP